MIDNEFKKESIVNSQLNYHVIPFVYNNRYDDAIAIIESLEVTKEKNGIKKSNKVWQYKECTVDKLLNHIEKLICSNDNSDSSTIGKRFVLQSVGRIKVGLMNNENYKYVFSNEKEEFKIMIPAIELYLFETNIGFIVINYEYPYDDMSIINNINYFLKKLNYKEFTINYILKKSKDESEAVTKNISEIIDSLIEELGVTSYFENNDKGKPENALVYSGIVLEKKISEDEVLTHLFRMRRSFKDTYKPSSLDCSVESKEVLRLFENSYWGVSLEGLANISYYVDDEETNAFFKDFIYKMKGAYFYLYILTLHQRYALINYSILAAKIPNSIEECIKLEKNMNIDEITISTIREKLSFFKLRCLFKQVSTITHQTQLYEAMLNVLGINELVEELDLEIEALAVITELKTEKLLKAEVDKREEERRGQQKEKELEQRERERFNEKLMIIASIIPVITLVSLIQPIKDLFRNVCKNGIFNFDFWVGMIVMIFLGLIIYRWAKFKKNDKK